MNIQSTNNINFTSVIPVKVIGRIQTQNGEKIRQATMDENISSAICVLKRFLERRQELKRSNRIKLSEFFKNDLDYIMPKKRVKQGTLIRHYSQNGDAYLFTGKDAKEVNDVAKQFGPAKHSGLEKLDTVHTFDVALLGELYHDTMTTLINKPSRRLKIALNEGQKKQPVELHIYTNCSTYKTKSGKLKYKFEIEKLSFEKVGTTPILTKTSQPTKRDSIEIKFSKEKIKPKTDLSNELTKKTSITSP